MMRVIAKQHVFHNAFLVTKTTKSALWPHGANPPNIHITQEKIGRFFKARVFHET